LVGKWSEVAEVYLEDTDKIEDTDKTYITGPTRAEVKYK